MTIHHYFSEIAGELKARSQRLSRDFATHRGSGGDNRESLVARFLCEHLPKAYAVTTGLVLAGSGDFSRQADVLIVDHLWNAPLYASAPENIWLVESVYALIEVKSALSPSSLADAVAKCQQFKALPRRFDDRPSIPAITDSLYVLWAFDAPEPATVSRTVRRAFRDVPASERPDFVLVPDSILVSSGSYYELAKLGQPDSQHRNSLLQAGQNLAAVYGEGIQVMELDGNSLLAWLVWLLSWLKRAGPRSASLLSYLPANYQWGHVL